MRAVRLNQVLNSIADRGRELLELRRGSAPERGSTPEQGDTPESSIGRLCRDLLSQRGEALGTALARDVVQAYEAMDAEGKARFFELLYAEFGPDSEAVLGAAERYRQAPDLTSFLALSAAVEPPRQELFRRINMAPQGTTALVGMRKHLLGLLPERPHLEAVDADLQHLLSSWFNRGFLRLERIDWRTPALILEKLIEYEAVHEIQGWDDLRRRLAKDRRCFAFFHPALRDEPLIFVEVALVRDMAGAIQPLVDPRSLPQNPSTADTAIFYSINNCQEGLRGISFGNLLIKQVVVELMSELPGLKTFATLSPIPGFGAWLRSARAPNEPGPLIKPEDQAALGALEAVGWHQDPRRAESLRGLLMRLCAHYLLREKRRDGRPLDPVARFHLGNGARLERINWLADTSANGLRRSAGLMVNYAYRLGDIETNHEAYANSGKVIASPEVRALLKS